ncbi:hypothetical protein ONZ45_g5371 [Pleurotus djamor]|nr:hypothetical protein ONZ45_g5371 [Pleurotus djamor]
MSDSQSPDWLIEQRVAQLEEISQRRNVLLKQMHQMLRRKHDIGTLIPALDEADSHELNEFLERFDLEKCPEGITSLSPDKLAIPMPSSFLDDLEDVDQDSDDILALRPTEDAEVGNRHHGHKAKPSQSRFRLRPADQDDSDRDELDFLSSTTPRSPSHHSPTPVKSRSTSQVSPNPTSNVIDISVSRPPSPAPIVVDGDSEAEEELPEDIPVVEDTAVSQANLDITGRDSSSHPSPLPEALPSHQFESRPPLEPDSAPSVRDGMDGMDVDDADGPSSPSNLVEDVTMEFTTKSEASQEPNALHPLGTPPQDDQSVPAAVASAIEGPLTPVEDVLSEVEPRPQDEGDTKSPGPGGQTASHPDNAKEEQERKRPSAEDVLMKEQSRVAQPLHNKQNAIVDLIPTNTEERLLPHQPPTVNPTLLFPPPAEVPRRLPPTFLSRPKSPGPDAVDYVFESKDGGDVEMSAPETSPTEPVNGPQYDPHYTLPPLKSLPIEYQRKGKLTKRKKERERKEKEKDGTLTKEGSNKEEGWAPMGMSKWAAVLNANPVHTKVSKASKCLLTKDWGIAFMELRLVKTFKRIEHLKDAGQWSFRQPKKQRGVGGLTKSHWDYLMDEMKWMRTDFREERRWKLAVAFNLSTAVLEWHAAGTNENRVALGICVKWTPPPPSEPPIEDVDAAMDIIDVDADHSEPLVLLDDKPATPKQDTQPEKPINALSILNYNSDDDDDEDQERSQDRERSISDGLDTAAALDDHFEAAAQIAAVDDMIEARSAAALQPKTEETDDTSALQSNANAMEVDVPTKVEQEPDNSQQVPQNDSSLQTALKTDSTNPLLMSTTTSRSSDEPSIPANGGVSKSALKQLFAPVREEIAYSDIDQLFLNFEDLDISQRIPKEPSAADVAALFESLPTPNDLTTVFPDLHPYGMFDLAPPTGAMLVPIGKYAHCKPTLLGPLQPSKKWKDGEWLRLDEYVVVAEEHPPSKPLDIFSDVFENNKPLIINPIQLPKDFRRTSEVTWTPTEDALLKSLIECYPYNWALISEYGDWTT